MIAKKTIVWALIALFCINIAFAVSNLTNLTKGNQTFYGIVLFADDVTENMIGPMFIITLFVVLFSSMIRTYSWAESTLVGSYICFGVSVLLNVIGLLKASILMIFGVIVILVSLLVFFHKK